MADQPTTHGLRRLLAEHRLAQADRDGAPRGSDAWLAADREVRRLEAAIVSDEASTSKGPGRKPDRS